MDYSQFLAMKQEIGLLVVFLLVFLYDTFMPKKAQGALPIVAIIGMVALTILGLCSCMLGSAEFNSAFAGMYETSPEISAIKTILNIGVIIVLVQSLKWVNGELMIMRRGEFFDPWANDQDFALYYLLRIRGEFGLSLKEKEK